MHALRFLQPTGEISTTELKNYMVYIRRPDDGRTSYTEALSAEAPREWGLKRGAVASPMQYGGYASRKKI